jgi:selenocysteine lyase/cysteine desulfurase
MDGLTLEALLADESLRRREFPVVGQKVYLAHAAVCPLPACVVRAVSAYVEKAGQVGQFEYLHRSAENGARELSGQMLGCEPAEIAFVASTSAGVSQVAAGLDWKTGDQVIIADGDFPSNVYPWLNLQRLGVQVRLIPRRISGLIGWEDVAEHLTERTRLVSLSSIHFATGAPLDVDGIGRQLQARGILFCVDAIQSLGAVPTSAAHVDFLIADAHKWLLGPQGIGVLYVRRACWDRLNPVLTGWKSVQASKDFSTLRLEFADSARRYEPGSLNALGIVGLHAALALLQGIGTPAIAARLRDLRGQLLAGLNERGYEIVGSAAADWPTGITSFRPAAGDVLALYRRLGDAGLVVSLRDDPLGNRCIRVSPHFYNTEAEIQALLGQLSA